MKRSAFLQAARSRQVRDGGGEESRAVLPDTSKATQGKNRRWSTCRCGLLLSAGLASSAYLLAGWGGSRLRSDARNQMDDSEQSNGRFPRVGTEDFSRRCGWTARPARVPKVECNFLVRPSPEESEGISQWASDIVSAFILSRQGGCSLLLDYGQNVDILEVLTPLPGAVSSPQGALLNWTVPESFECGSHPQCTRENNRFGRNFLLEELTNMIGGEPIYKSPNYRLSYDSRWAQKDASKYPPLARSLPGYELETGMACAFESLFRLSPSASRFEPGLFSNILSKLHHRANGLVIALYIRTRRTDLRLQQEQKGSKTFTYPESMRLRDENALKKTIECALQLEKNYLSANPAMDGIVWMMVTDYPDFKQRVAKSYSTTHSNVTGLVRREVVITSSSGKHTKPKINPSTADFAQAFIDWYLIGESDLVVSYDGSFGRTAAARTHRPFYNNLCTRVAMSNFSAR